MAKNKEARPLTYAVSVVGLSGTEKEKGNCGVGKSCLCNRYVRSNADSYYTEHTSVLSTIDFGGRVVNNDHFLYWGEVPHRSDDGLECKIQIIEQTEFIDDQTFLPHRSTNLQPYTKRAAASKIQSAEKLMYICTDQLGLEQDFDQKQMADGKLNVDGFILCIDVSKGCNRKFEDQMKFVNSLYSQMVKSKKPIVIAATKCDECVEQYLRDLQAFAASKKNLLVVETSARSSINVDLCFNALTQQMDKTRGKPKTIPYLEAYKVHRQLVATVSDKFEKRIVQTVRDYHTSWKMVSNTLKNHPDYEEYINLEGTRKARNTLNKHIEQLKQEHIRKRREEYFLSLPKILNNLLNNLEELENLSWSEAQSILKSRAEFQFWFVLLEHTPWDETDQIDKVNDRRVPFDLLKTSEGEKIYQNHVQHLFSEKRRLEMKDRFKKTLDRVHFISPGQPWEEVMCFVMEDEAYKYISESDRRDVYSQHQQEIVERAKEEFQEMLFEHAELFYDLDLNATPSCDKMSEIHTVLNEEPRYRALQKLAPDRESLLLKHIGFVYHPTKETCLSGQSCVDMNVEQVLANRLVQLDHSRSNLYYNSANIDKVNLCLLGREGLAQELANEIRAQSTDDEYTLDGKIYELELLPVDVNSTLLFSHTWASTFKPHGIFCVFSSIESLNCIGDCIGRIRGEIAQNRRERYAQPLPFILILANQRDSVCKNMPILRHQGQQLANKLQCTFVDIPSDTFPRKFNELQIKQALRGVLEGLKHNFDVMSPLPSIKDMSETDLRIVMCAVCGDPFSVDLILSPFLDSHSCSAGQPGQSNTLILNKIIGDSRRRIQVTVLSYHSSIGIRKDELVHGYILVYSAKRKSSMAMLRAFLAEVQDVIPVQMVAITDSQADFFENDEIKELMTEGEHIATEITAKFTALYSLSQYHRQTEVFTPFFNEVLEKKSSIESAFMYDSSRDCMGASEDVFPQSPHSHSPAYNYYPDSEDDTEAPPPYSPIGDDVQLLPTPSERAKYRIDLEGNEYPVHSTPLSDHERNHRVPPPVRPKPILPKSNVKKLDPNLLKTIEAGMRSNRRQRGPMAHGEDVEASDNYADPIDTLLKSKGFSDDIYAVPEDTQSRIVKMRNSFGGLHVLHGDEENGFDRKAQASRRPSKYKHRSKILFSKTKMYHRRVHSDVSDDESGPAMQKKKKGRAHRGSEEDPLLSPADPWKGGIDNPAITSDPEQDDMKKKKKKTPKTKEPKKPKSKPPKPLYPPTRRNWDSNYFGVPLQNLVTPDRPIPLFIEKCVDYIERTGLNTEGLYRVSGNKTDQDNIQKQFDQDHSVDLIVMDVAVNAVAGALKAFFADLPDPLIPYILHPELVEAAKIVDHIERLQVLKEIVRKFPAVNYEVFKYVITHLNRVSQQSKTTLMTADNLSICFWPTLMRPDFENKDTLSTTKLNQSVIESFIQQSHYFFYGGDIQESSSTESTPPPHHCHSMVEALLPLQLPPPLQPQQIQHSMSLQPDPLI
ncbi:rho GTPase-activating protein 5 [Salvelinus fontinalis]|uniref:Rho GTPase-activating protein 5 n=1 Tax=Salvelinus namaycush TaxID=8040 RepID=A0A8U1EX98_SALNM|nr:rho GTPase-activating protein 5 [Salvelinus namaycush]XP_055719626.1 rho GTPase-activating protein 5 [Salvelinus fontinalis]XP_055719627.1 rho GTPase-activating protein 5 [Salvelinus fontinalis]XP_055719628.1 rho GTPase-activating protein 5 [Salvelinus fontinalis]